MLLELRVQNLAVFREAQLSFAPGLVVITGETGAGKSLLVEAIELISGARAQTSVIRSGARMAVVEASFSLSHGASSDLRTILEREELLDDEEVLTICREVRSDGRNVARVNGRTVRVGLLRELARHLVDLHGQSEHLSLLQPRHQLELLDGYAHLTAERKTLQEQYQRLQRLLDDLAQLEQQAQRAARERDLIEFELREIEGAGLEPGEEERLRRERQRLAHAQQLAEDVQRCLALIDESPDPEQPAASDLLGSACRVLSEVARIDGEQVRLADRLNALCQELAEIARQLRAMVERYEPDPGRLEEVEHRLRTIERLKRKYGRTVEEIMGYADGLRARLRELDSVETREPQLREEIARAAGEVDKLAARLSDRRRRAATELAKAVRRELAGLGFLQSEFRVELVPVDSTVQLPDGGVLQVGPLGREQVRFLVSPNPGEPLRPLGQAASGGEMARMMLACKVALAEVDPVPTLVFDEVDQGVGGRAGGVIGRRLKELARHHQVLCITHLPQVAAYADQHFVVEKRVVRRRTETTVRELRGDERVEELAAMLGHLSEANRASARELLNSASRN